MNGKKLIWICSPHPGDRRYDEYWEEDWPLFKDYVSEHLEFITDNLGVGEELVLKIRNDWVDEEEYELAMEPV